MTTQELQIVRELYNIIREWLEKYSTDWLSRSVTFKQFYQAVKHQLKAMQLLSNTQSIPELSVEEKLANAVFYVEGDVTYTIEYSMPKEGYFVVSSVDDQSGDIEIKIDSIPADAYFLGTVRL